MSDQDPSTDPHAVYEAYRWERRENEKLEAENSRLREDLERLLEFGKRLIGSGDENERSIGGCICEGARRVEAGDE